MQKGNSSPKAICLLQLTQSKEQIITQVTTSEQSKMADLLEVLTI